MNVTDSDAEYALFTSLLGPDDLCSIERVASGVHALQELRTRTPDQLPNLIVTPWILPMLTGCEFIAELKADSRLRAIPIIVISDDLPAEEVNNLYAAGASCIVRRGNDLTCLDATLKTIRAFWVELATLPSAR